MNRLVVLRLSALGDVVHTIPAVVALQRALPDVALGWVVESPYRDLVELVAGVRAIPVSMKRWGRHPIDSWPAIRGAVRAIRTFDASIDFQGLIKSAMIGWLSGGRERWGFDRNAIREKPAGWFLNRRVAIDTSRHVVDWNLQLAAALSAEAGHHPGVDFSAFCEDPGGKLARYERSIIILPGAGRPNKQWAVTRFRELVGQLMPPVVIAWGPGEKQLADAIGGEIAPPTSLRELATLLRTASLVIGGDTGPLHLAAALGTPVVGLYGPTNPSRNGPYGQAANIVETFSSTKTMEDIAVSAVLAKVEEVMARGG